MKTLKQIILNWLGIEDIKRKLSLDIEHSLRDVIKQQVEADIKYLLEYDESTSNCRYSHYHARMLRHLIETAVAKSTKQILEVEIKESIESEKFIDNVVARIKNKQLS